jgi:Ca2+-binding RTX toxin-like protein
MCHGYQATIFGPGTLIGTSHRDVIVGTLAGAAGSEYQVIRAGAGNDLVCAGPAGSHVFGGAGDDKLFGQGDYLDGSVAYGDVLNGGSGDDLLDPGPGPEPCCADGFSFDGSRHGVTVDLKVGRATGQGNDRLEVSPGAYALTGSAHDDVLLGTDASDEFSPGGGNDVVRGRGGNDFASSDSGNDLLYGGAGRDQIFACNGSIFGGPGGDKLSSAVGFYTCGDDSQTDLVPVMLSGGRGPDLIVFDYQLRDGDAASGGPGTDELSVFFGFNDHASPTSGSPLFGDLVTGSFAMDGHHARYQEFEKWSLQVRGGSIITGSEGPDVLSVGLGPLTAYLLGGDDIVRPLNLAPADDFVDGGDGVDSADLGNGSDVCVNVETGPC